VLKGELKSEETHLRDRLHAKTLEQIFIEERIYQAIEEMKTAELVDAAVRKGLAAHQDQIKHEVTGEDIEALLKIPIRRISLYDIERSRKEMQEIRQRLRQIKGQLDAIIPYAIDFLKELVAKYRDAFPRRTEVVSFARVDVREVAQRNLKLRYDKNTGYLGYEVDGQLLCEVSHYDRVLVIRKDGTYSVIDAPDKLFVDKGMLHCGLVDKEMVFNVVYKDGEDNTYLKRCQIDQFILNKVYALAPEGCKVLRLTTDSERVVALDYKPRPRLRVLQEEFAIAQYPVRGLKAGGIRLSNKEVSGCKIT